MKNFKDRKDGWYVKPPTPLHAIMPHLMVKRTEAEVSMTEEFDVTELLKYLEYKNKTGKIKYTFFHAVLTAVGKTIYNRPLLNRFISGRRMYDRKYISYAFVAKQKFEDHSEETLMILKLRDNMNIDDIGKKVVGEVKKVRDEKTNTLNNTMDMLGKLPRWLLMFVAFIIKKLDFYGKVPNSLCKSDPNYATVLFSNLGSIKSNSCYHHLNNYGTNSLLITIGEIKNKEVLNEKGKSELRSMVNLTFTLDERIADGFYFAKSVNLLKKIINNPDLLDNDVSEVLEDVR